MKTKFLFLFIIPCSLLKAQTCAPATSYADLDINNVNVRILGGGDMWWDQGLQIPKYEVPKGSGHHTMFAGSLWMGGLDIDNTLHTAAQTYRQTGNDFWPGPINNSGSTTTANCQLYDRSWKVSKSEINAHIANPTNPPTSISLWPAKGNNIGGGAIVEDMAPFVDVNGNGTYEPTAGDYPMINGDQAVYFIVNDVGNTHSETGGAPLGVEVHIMAYSYATNNILNNTTFYNYNFKNKSSDTYHDFYVGFWADCDLGGYNDDFIGSDSTRNAALFYNADALDSDYGSNIPITAVAGINTPLENNIPVKMKHLGYIYNDATNFGNPVSATHFYNYLTGKWKDGSPWGFNYAYPGSPCVSSELSMVHPTLLSPGDLRTIQSFGPMTFAPGQCKNITTAVITTFNSSYPNPCFNNIRSSIDSVKSLHQISAINDISCTTTSFLNENLNVATFTLFPNPASETLILNASNAVKSQYKIYSVEGSLVAEGNTINNSTNIEVGTLNKGLYFVVISDELGRVLTVKKFVKD